jgi:hypothetical protein
MPNGVVPSSGDLAGHGVEELRREMRTLTARVKALEAHYHSAPLGQPILEKPEPEQVLRFSPGEGQMT